MPEFSNYAPDFRNYAHKISDVDSVHMGAQKRHQSIMFFKYVVGNLYVFYGSLSQPSAVQTAHAEFVKRGPNN